MKRILFLIITIFGFTALFPSPAYSAALKNEIKVQKLSKKKKKPQNGESAFDEDPTAPFVESPKNDTATKEFSDESSKNPVSDGADEGPVSPIFEDPDNL